ncbi:CoF synthetase [Gaetbulibacter sp. M240]|uniref:CoF synthetase n=1 Tax=Gaetbulibacter sp. M240 TaxID=3126511 RepID=UPI00374E979C
MLNSFILNKIRKKAFNTLDFLSGNNINSHHNEIKSILDPHSKADLNLKNEVKILQLIDHATNTTEFYKPYGEFKTLEHFPVIKKTIVQENFESFRSKSFLGKDYYKVSTSGSTGVPFFLFQDKNKRKRNTADVIYYYDKVGHQIGNRLYEFEVWRSHNKKSCFKSFLQNVFQFDVSKLTDKRISELFLLLGKDKGQKSFLGFASAYETICQYIEKHNISTPLKFNIQAIIANSEYLNDYTREHMSKFFDAPIYSRYSNEEIGLLAQQTKDSGKDFMINWASYHIELLEFDSNEPVKFGQPGRIVVTDLYNYCMPLIRFDTGDIGVFTKPKKGQLPNFKHIEGRKMDLIYDTTGNLVSSFVVYTKFYKYYKFLKQYQFIQTDEKNYVIKLNLIDDNFEYEDDLIKSVESDFGEDAQIKIEYVHEIPPLSSGKRKKVMSLYIKEKSDS